MTRRSRWVRPLVGIAIAATFGVAPAANASTGLFHDPMLTQLGGTPPGTDNATKSLNWSGYDSTSGPFTSASAKWTEPTGVCTGGNQFSSFWVGIDGAGSDTVEQTGTDVDCNGTNPVYYGWYEFFPAPSVPFSNPVKPGDSMSASVSGNAGVFIEKLSDLTQGWTQQVTGSVPGAEEFSAEVIAEAPSSGATLLPLADFGTVTFTGASANGKPLKTLKPKAIDMVSGTVVKAQPTKLKGGRFSVTWHDS